MKKRNLYVIFFVVVLAVGMSLSGCSSKGDILKEVSGQWQNNKDQGTVVIQLVGQAKSMKFGDQTYDINVEKVEMDKFQVDLKAKNGNSQPETWTLREVWDDNGNSFRIALKRGNENMVLVPKGQS
jgi:hypothetical protein